MEPDLYNINQNKIGSLAIISFVFSIISYIFCPIIGGIVAVICGAVELDNINRKISSANGKVFALIGLWLGIVNIVIFVGFILFLIFFSSDIIYWIRKFFDTGDEINVIYSSLVNSFTVIADI